MWWCDPDMNNAHGGGKYSTGKIWATRFGYRNLRSYIHGIIIINKGCMANFEELIIEDIKNNIARYESGDISIKTCLHLISVFTHHNPELENNLDT